MQVNQTEQMGQRMQFDGVLDLNEVDEIWMQEELLCNIYLTGRTRGSCLEPIANLAMCFDISKQNSELISFCADMAV